MKNPSIDQRLAPSKNNHLLVTPTPSKYALTRSGKEVRVVNNKRFHRFREALDYFGEIDYTGLENEFDSWEEIQEEAIDIFHNHIDLKAQTIETGPRIDAEHASIAGVGTIGAFLRTIPEVIHDSTISHSAIARQSIRTMMWWSNLSKEAESDLSTLLSNPKPNLKLPPRAYNVGLRFDPAFFKLVENPNNHTQWVDVDRQYIESLGKETIKSIDHHISGTDVYFGCPFRSGLPKIYNAMTQAAIRSHLL